MIARLKGLFRRYMTANLTLSGPEGPLLADGTQIGWITDVHWVHGRLNVRGRVEAYEITLEMAGMRSTARINGQSAPFLLTLPWPPELPLRGGVANLLVGEHPAGLVYLHRVRRTQARFALRFAVTVVSLIPDALDWFRRRDPACKARIKAALGLSARVNGGPLDVALFAPASEPSDTVEPIILIVPVYNAFELVQDCLDRVVRHTEQPWRMVLVEDGSTDVRVRTFLRDWAATRPEGQVTLIEAPENRGFIASVNTAFAEVLVRPATDTGPVILLNTDAMVPPAWVGRLIAPLLADPSVASVTPMSNDAEIFSVPAICVRSDLAPGVAEAVDAIARTLGPDSAWAEAPTGVGFCMALSRRFLEQEPLFDAGFGRGYGEEVDWCQKVRARGGRHLGTGRLFVEHKGGSSFGSAEKAALIAKNNAVISKRYPSYDAEVQDFLLSDPMRSARVALALAWAASTARENRAIPIYLGHTMGGGAEHWLQARLREDTKDGQGAVVLRVGGAGRWQIEAVSTAGVVAGWTEDFDLITRLLAPLGRRRVVYSCGVGDSDPVTLPRHMLSLLQSPSDRLEVLFHDYFPLSPSFTLLQSDGRFHGPPLPADQPGAVTHRLDGSPVSLKDWQTAWGRLLERANRIQVFCPSGAALVEQVWPGLSDRLDVTPHRMLSQVPALPRPHPKQPPVLAVLGNIAPHKGAGLVQALARMSQTRRGFRFVLIGNIDPGFALPAKMSVHGDYSATDIARLAEHYKVTHWLIPSVWPETFSFTTHEALATGLPVLAFDIGAQGAAVEAAENGVPLPYRTDTDLADIVVAMMTKERQNQ